MFTRKKLRNFYKFYLHSLYIKTGNIIVIINYASLLNTDIRKL